jgi:PAS domain S-box-containing protein
MRAVALRYALAPACILLAVLLYLSPAGPMLHPTGLFAITVVAAAWFGGAGPGFLAAVLATFTLPQLIPMTYLLHGGVLDLPRFITFSIAGLAVGWWSFRRRQIEAALREYEKRHELAMNASNEGFWDWIPAGDKYYLSPRLLEICGFAPGTTFAGRAAVFEALAMPPEDRAALQHAVNEHFAGKTPHMEKEFRILVNGEVRWIHARGRATRNANGEVVRWTGAASDVTARKRVEEALRLSEERHARAMEASAAGHWDWNMLTDELFVSERAQEMFALPPGRLPPTRTEFMSLMSKYRADMDEGVEASKRSGTYDRVYRVVPQTGPVRWLNSRGKVYRDAAGTPVRMAGSVTDITERRLAEEALRNSERRYALAMQAAGDGHIDWDLVSGEFYISPRLLEIVGHPPDATFADRADWVRRFPFHPEDRPKWEAAIAAHFAGRESHFKMGLRIVVRGEVRWTAFHFLSTRDAAGKPIRWTGSIGDITEQKRVEEALRESEQRYELAMAASESGYWDWDVSSDRFFVSARANELVGFAYESTFTNRAEFRAHIPVHADDWAKWEAARKELFAGTGERLAMELRYIVRGETHWHSLEAICRRDETGKVVRWTGSATDVTERKRAEEELKTMERKLRQAQRLEAMGTLAGGIAHDFNNILGAILGYGELALRDTPNGSRLERDVKKIVIAGERGRALVDRVLAFSRSAIGERVPVHVERVVREALDLISAKLPPGVTVHAQLRAGPAAVLADATQVHQVVTNLATNAIQAMAAGGTLRIELAIERVEDFRAATIGGRGAGEYVVLTVADTGAGIAPEIVDRIFDPYFTTKEVGTGTGLGLSLVHGIVTDLGGAIDVASAVGTGSTFTVYLPRSGDAAEAGEEKASTLPRGDGRRVLVVDDEEPLMEVATRALEDLGYKPVGFTSSSAALAAFRADPQRFDALITDERMPGMTGSALIREVRGIRSSMPIVLMSGYLGSTAKARESRVVEAPDIPREVALEIGADEVLQKPLSARDLAASLAKVLRL